MRVLAVALLLAGCANTLQLTVQSNPAGATIYADGLTVPSGGTLTYDQRTVAVLDSGQCIRLNPITAVWVSGAKAVTSPEICPHHPRRLVLTIGRPDVPGMDVDANYALRLEQTAIMRRQAANAEFDAGWRQAQDLYPKTTTCRTTSTGAALTTTCR